MGTQVAFVHMSAPAEADRWFARSGLPDVVRISDPERTLYRQFGLEEASLRQLSHPRVWLPWFRTAILNRHGVGAPGPNWRQLTGAFVVRSGQIVAAQRHRNFAARPDYIELVHRGLTGGVMRGC
jgi:alkyl-hydroperoxide reductase/thiol specific antioxidant family protein